MSDINTIEDQIIDEEVCEVTSVDTHKTVQLQKTINEEEILGMVDMFKALSDPTRMKIAYMLDQAQELCVCDVAAVLGSSMAATSHHLRTLKNLDITMSRKEGKNVYYSLKDDHIRILIQMTLEHQREKMDDEHK
ncbi:ArsR/SmtB family transcription factor [Paenibacillus sp. IHBB 10380]|uniref:ArsR/SmtB family transcription factor n=1 Tax=Paenibacillus sp. IHBB 10380 TaxID=1566358 RepID=UPI0005CFDA68|nr:metalloregulator ArsR/SmtB family transcription factor [Paenibacillus sp. IHBB 10380]AJS60786.1 ArsR family transcriptional regulator [Paenibacillus sp. IHBB 10380]